MSDVDYVTMQLLEAVEITVRKCHENHPYGSDTARDDWTEIEINNGTDAVVIDLETDTIPVDVLGDWSDDGFEVQLQFDAPQVQGVKVTYDVEVV